MQAIEQLIDYLDQNLLTLYTYLLRKNFKTLLSAIWQECLEEFQDVIRENEEVHSCLYPYILLVRAKTFNHMYVYVRYRYVPIYMCPIYQCVPLL